MKKRYKILDQNWHLAHNQSLNTVPNIDWYWLCNPVRQFSEQPRGLIENYNLKGWVPYYENGVYDAVILHLDQQSIDPREMEMGKGSIFNDLVDQIDSNTKKILIMHGTPSWKERYEADITKENYLERGYQEFQIGMSSELIELFKPLAKKVDFIVFNSHQAQRQWGFEGVENATTIIHGMTDLPWLDLPKEPRVITTISPVGLDDYYGRDFILEVREGLARRNIEFCHIMVDANFNSFEDYRRFIGSSLIYFNSTRDSCMPRSRTEAMLSGCCVVSTFNQDAETFLKDRENAFRVDPENPEYAVKLIELLINDYKKALSVGQAGKKTAQELFSKGRYNQDWLDLLSKVIK